MAITSKNQRLISYKKLAGKAHTNPEFGISNEAYPSFVQMASSFVFAEEIETNSTAQEVEFELEQIPLSTYPGSDTYSFHTGDADGLGGGEKRQDGTHQQTAVHGFILKLLNQVTIGATSYAAGTALHLHQKLQIIPESFGSIYKPKVYSSTTIADSNLMAEDGLQDWVLDCSSGILFMQDIYDSVYPQRIKAYIYTGKYLDEVVEEAASSGGSADAVLTTNVDQTIDGIKTFSNEIVVDGNIKLGNIGGSHNIGLGQEVLPNIGSAVYNIAIGYKSLDGLTTGGHNTAVGAYAGYHANDKFHNTYLGYAAGYNTIGSYNTFIGDYAGHSLSQQTLNNTTIISNGSGYERLRIDSNGNISINSTSATDGGITYRLLVNGSLKAASTLFDSMTTTGNIVSYGTITGVNLDVSGELEGQFIGVGNLSSTSGYGISLYAGGVNGEPTYGIMFAGTPTFGTYGPVTSDWATYFTMNDVANRGWIFRRKSNAGSTNVAAISNTGVAQFAGSVTASSFVGNLTGTADKVANLLTRGSYLTGNDYDGSAATTWAVDATTDNSGDKIVARDASGNFSAGTITATLNGNATYASSATYASNATKHYVYNGSGVSNHFYVGLSYGYNNYHNQYAHTSLRYVPYDNLLYVPYIAINSSNKTVNGTTYNLHVNGTALFSGNVTTNGSFVGNLTGDITGNAETATKLANARTITLSGDIAGSVSFNGSQDVDISTALQNSVTAGTYRSVTVNSKGLITAGTNPTTAAGYGLTDVVTTYGNQTIGGTKTFSSTGGATIILERNDAIIASGETLGSIHFDGTHTGNTSVGARIWAQADANWGTANNGGTRLYFGVNDGGAGDASFTSDLIIDAGKIGIATTPQAQLHFANNPKTGFANYSDYQIILYTSSTAASSYGLGIESGNMKFNTNSGYKFYVNGVNKFTFNSDGSIDATKFIGSLQGNADTATKVDVTQASSLTTTLFKVAMYDTGTENLFYAQDNFHYSPMTTTFVAPRIAINTTSTNVNNYPQQLYVNGLSYFNGSAYFTNNVTTAGIFNGDLTGNVTGNVTGNADTADKIKLGNADGAMASYNVTFSYIASNNTHQYENYDPDFLYFPVAHTLSVPKIAVNNEATSYNLYVNGTTYLTGDVTTGGSFIGDGSQLENISAGSNGYIQFNDGNNGFSASSNLVYTDTLNELKVGNMLIRKPSSTSTEVSLHHQTNSGTTNDYILKASAGGTTSLNCKSGSTIQFKSANSTKMTVYNNGKVGIGTTYPDEMLEIYGSSPFIKITNTAQTESGIHFVDSGNETGDFAKVVYDSNSQELRFYCNSSAAAIRIKDGRDIYTPANSTLTVNTLTAVTIESDNYNFSGANGIFSQMIIESANSSSSLLRIINKAGAALNGIQFEDPGTPYESSQIQLNGSLFQFKNEMITGITIHSNGNVVVGNTNADLPGQYGISTQSSFGVQGHLVVANGATLTGNVSVDGNITGILQIKQTSDSVTSGLRLIEANSTSSWTLSLRDNADGFKKDNRLAFYYGTTERGYINPDAGGGALNFTGQHRNISDTIPVSSIEQYLGLIVVSDGTYASMEANNITINEALPKVSLASKRNQKSVFGVVSDAEDENAETREYAIGNFVSVNEKTIQDTRLIINSLGEGGIWVTNINGNLENGDYITTCEIPGYGMKQDDDLLHNYTVAKITCDCDFSLESPIYICEEFEHEGTMYKRAFVGCTYHCG